MRFDNGEVLQGLDETWTFLGATVVEWIAGFAVFILISIFGRSPATMMPFMLLGWVTTTVLLAALRSSFPDQERGLRNYLLVICGIPPRDIPLPAALQPVWSAAPVHELPENSRFVRLGLDRRYPSFIRDLQPADSGGE